MSFQHVVLFSLLFLLTEKAVAISDFDRVYIILQQNCKGCHGGDNPAANLSFEGDQEMVYEQLLNVAPQNQAARDNNYTLVNPGHVDRSFLFKKVNYLLPPIHPLKEEEGEIMPSSGEKLSNVAIETIRQWITFGAKFDSKDFNPRIIEDYYIDGGLEMVNQPPPPEAGEGFQIHYGPIFMEPGEEIQFFTKYEPNLSDSLAIRWVQTFDHAFSHHTLVYKLDQATAEETADGHVAGVSLDVASPLGKGVPLPPGTAYFMEPGSALNLNYHIKNYSSTNILAANAYFNVYTVPKSSIKQEMKFLPIGYDPTKLIIPANGEITQFEDSYLFEEKINMWLLTSHTHALGQDFDIYLGTADGQKGEQIYEGFYDETYTFNQGYYDFEHVPVRLYYPFYTFNAGESIVYEAQFLNTGTSTVKFGGKTTDEMMYALIQYTEGEVLEAVSIPELDNYTIDGANFIYTNDYCLSESPIALTGIPTEGTFAGAGMEGNIFDPQLAGTGLHTITYTYDNITAYYQINIKNAPPKPEVQTLSNGVLSATILPDANYQWYKNDSLLVEATYPSVIPEGDGHYVLAVKYDNDCYTYSDTIVVGQKPTHLQEDAIKKPLLEVYPNPITDQFYCTIEGLVYETFDLYLLDVNGQLIDHQTFPPSNQNQSIHYKNHHIPSGIYFLHIQSPNQNLVQKVVWK